MGKIISVHSFRGGTGKSNLVANLAVELATQGKRVAVIDTDIQSPGLHVLFGIDIKTVQYTFTDYLLNRCAVSDTALDVTQSLEDKGTRPIARSGGQVYIIPSSMKVDEITTILSEGYDISLLTQGYDHLIQTLQLDYLLIDTHPGINEETLLSIGISEFLIVIMRIDQQDYQGTALTVQVAKQLTVPKLSIVINKVLPELDFKQVSQQVEAAYDVPVAAILALDHDMVRLGSQDVFCLRYPKHPLSQEMARISTWVQSHHS